MVTPSPRLGLALDADTDPIEAFRTNWSRVDQAMPVMWVADNVVPSDAVLYDGAIVAELTSGKIWVAHKNVGGTFDHIFIRYPWSCIAFSNAVPVGSGAWAEYTFSNFASSGSFNSSAADLASGRLTIPVKGIYAGWVGAHWVTNVTGIRCANVNFNAAAPSGDVNTGSHFPALTASDVYCKATFSQLFAAGDHISINLFQNSGGVMNTDIQVFCHMVNPVV